MITWLRLGCLEKKKGKMKALRAQSSGKELRSVSVRQSEEPDGKKQKKEKKEEEKRKKAEAEAEAKKKEEDARKKKEAEDLRTQLQSESDIILYGYLFDETFRCEMQDSLRKQAEYEKKLVFSILERTPNYRSRVQENEHMNKIAIDVRNERMRAAEERRVNPVQDAAEAEKVRKQIEEKEKEEKRLKEKEQRKAARKAERTERKEEQRKEKKARKAEKKEKKRSE